MMISNNEKYKEIKKKIYAEYPHSEISKINYITEEYVKLYESDSYLPEFPLVIGFKITGLCNLRCNHCYACLNGKNPPKEKLKKILTELCNIPIYQINLSGGEPLIRNDFLELYSYIKKNNKRISIGIYTNGILINKELIDSLCSLWDFENDFFHISFDGLSDKTLFQIRGMKFFNILKKNIRLVLSKKMKVRLHSTISIHNIKELYEMFLFANNYKIETYSISPLIMMGNAVNIKGKFDSIDYFNQILKIRSYQKKHKSINVRVFMPSEIFLKGMIKKFGKIPLNENNLHLNKELFVYNYHTFYNALIDSSLNLNIAFYLKYNNILGNLNDGNFDTIWKESINQRRLFFKRNLTNSICSNCEYFEFCQGGDWIITYNVLKTINSPHPFCYKKTRGNYESKEISYK